MSMLAKLISIQTGRSVPMRRESDPVTEKEPPYTAIIKTPVQGPVFLHCLGLEGDQQTNLKHHGGPDKAVLAYCAGHYDRWKEEIPDKDWVYGGFGENLTLAGLDEHSACIGDTFRIGEVIVQVSEPRQPCHKLAWRWEMKDLPKIVLENQRSGWYMRVLQEGILDAGMDVERIEHPYPRWSVALVNDILYHIGDDFDRAERLYECPLLAEKLRRFIREAIDTYRPQTRFQKLKSVVQKLMKKGN